MIGLNIKEEMIHFDWMVISGVDREGITFKGTRSGEIYRFYWNPIRTLRVILSGRAYLGFPPLTTKHIKGSWDI